jgi:hypothetical protein
MCVAWVPAMSRCCVRLSLCYVKLPLCSVLCGDLPDTGCYSHLITRQQTADSSQQTADSRQQTADRTVPLA